MIKFKIEGNSLSLATFTFLILFSIAIHAEENSFPKLMFSGFGTLGAVHSSEDQAEFLNNLFVATGAGHTRSWSLDVDTKLGGQVTALITPKLSAVVQAIAEHQYDNTFTPHVEWANIKYDFTPDFSIRLGRVVLPAFMVSDYRKVGYINPWVRPPQEVYLLIPITKNDGIDASYRFRIGEVTNTIMATYGGLEVDTSDGTRVKGDNQWNVSNTIEYGPFTFNLAYTQSKVNVESTQALFAAFRQFGPQGNAIDEKFNCDGKTIRLGSLGFSYDPGDWFLMGELVRRDVDCFLANNTAGYITAGYRINKFTPYFTYAQVDADGLPRGRGLDLASLPPFLVATAAGLNAGLDTLFELRPVQQTFSVGMRWDFMKNTALKLQFDHSRTGENSLGTLLNPQPGFQSDKTYNVFSATIDFVF